MIIIIQSCASTYQGSYTLPEALASERKARITIQDNERIEYQKIDTLKGQWVGQKAIDNRIVLEPIIPNRITKIELGPSPVAQAKEGQKALGIILGGVLLIGLMVIAVSNADFMGGN
ncbi:MAG: hypothetical protein KJN59_05035 [Bacteroidia bacterium]|nr:hypothetical protein [Bacteroidia bacterium]